MRAGKVAFTTLEEAIEWSRVIQGFSFNFPD